MAVPDEAGTGRAKRGPAAGASARAAPIPAAHPSCARSLEHLRRQLAQPLAHPDVRALRDFSEQTLTWLLRHFTTLPDQSIGRSGSRAELETLLREPAPEQGMDFHRVLAQFEERVAAHACRVNHPRFFAFIPGAPTFLAVLGDLLCAGTNFFAGVWLEAAGPAQVELVVLDWFKELLGYPAAARGILTGGGSEANLTALLVARERLGFEERGRAILYLSAQRHWSVDRMAKVIGLRPDQQVVVPSTGEFRMDPSALAAAVAADRSAGRLPWAVCANAGATNTGAVDPLAKLVDVCRMNEIWLHVDGAYGWPAVLDEREKVHFVGIDQADSVTLDPHKWFAQTFEAGCVLVRNGQQLAETFSMRPEYMQDVAPAGDEINFADYGLALTRRFRALKIWLSVKVLGLGWFRSLVRHCCGLAELAEAMLRRSPAFEILCPRQLSTVCFRYVPPGPAEDSAVDRLNLAIIDGVRATGRAFLSSTRLGGRVAQRLCFVNWRTTAADLEEALGLVEEVGNRLSASGILATG
jgi:glutamate/tyrosine decarboxylase-like PLP-dependent enzyme